MLNEKVPELSRKQLREFGLVSGAIVIVLFGLLIPWLFSNTLPRWPWVVAGVLTLWALAVPNTLIYLYRPWMKFGAVVGFINTRILLGIVFYIMITPIGLVRKAFGGSSIKGADKKENSYRVNSEKPDNKHMENPY